MTEPHRVALRRLPNAHRTLTHSKKKHPLPNRTTTRRARNKGSLFLKVALVHDWLTGTRGGEKVLLELVRMFPGAPVFTLFHFPGSQTRRDRGRRRSGRRSSRSWSRRARDYRKLLPLFFVAAETWDLSGFDLVISSSHCVAKSAKKAPGAFHLCYCHTPVRYLHDQFDDYFREQFRGRPGRRRASRGLRFAPGTSRPYLAWTLFSRIRRT